MKGFRLLGFVSLLVYSFACTKPATASTDAAPTVDPVISSADNSVEAVVPIYIKAGSNQGWKSFANGMPAAATVSGFTQLNGATYASTDFHGLYKLEPGQDLWIRQSNGLPASIDINCILSIGERLLLGSFHQGVFISDDGQNWMNIQYGMGPPNLYTFEMQQYAGWLYAAQWYGIFQSTTAGNQWELISELPDSTAFASFQLTAAGLLAGAAMR